MEILTPSRQPKVFVIPGLTLGSRSGFFGACVHTGLRKSFLFLPPRRAWHAWLSMELLLPDLFLRGNIDLTLLHIAGAHQPPAARGTEALVHCPPPSHRSACVVWFWSLHLFPPMSLLQTSSTEKSWPWLTHRGGLLPPTLRWVPSKSQGGRACRRWTEGGL